MKRAYFFSLFLYLTTTFLLSQSNPQAKILDNYGKLPLSFEANQGQVDARVKFLSRTLEYTLFLTEDEAVLALSGKKPDAQKAKIAGTAHTFESGTAAPTSGGVLRMKLRNANSAAKVIGIDELAGTSNYFIGNDSAKWHSNVPTYAKVKCEGIYPGIDLVYYGHQRELEYDFVLQPGASPQAIRLGIQGAKRLRLVRGDLLLASTGGDVHLQSPHVYQEKNGVRHEIGGRYVIKGKNEVGFEVAAYDRRRALVIDPVLAYSTYLGGSYYDSGHGIAVDSAGNAYVTGDAPSTDFPTVNAIQPANHGRSEAFVTKFNADGSAPVYSTYLGGSGDDAGFGIAVDTTGNAYVTGYTASTDFPIKNAIQPMYGGVLDAFVTKINASGTALVYSTYLGGSDGEGGAGIAVDSAGRAYIVGGTSSTDFPVKNAIQPLNHGGHDAFVTKINASGSAFVYSTYLGGGSDDYGSGIAVNSAGNAYVTGHTPSTDFPIKNAIQPTNHGGHDAFVTKINASGSAFVYSTYLGGGGDDYGSGIAVDSAGNAYVTGYTPSTDFPTVNAIQPTFSGYNDAFVTKINAVGNALEYSTYLGGRYSNFGTGIAVDSVGNAYVDGWTTSPDFPSVNAIQPTIRGYGDVFVTKINASGSAYEYSTYLGGEISDTATGIAVDSAGSAYVTGYTYSYHFPRTVFAFQPQRPQEKAAYGDAFVSKIASQSFLSISPAKWLSFPTQVIGTSAAKKITLTNQGSGTLTINEPFIQGINAGDFAETNACTALAPAASCTISVTFTPTSKDTRRALLGISDTDPTSPQAIVLSGTGTVVSLSTKNLHFGDQAVGTSSATQNVTLKNTGSTLLYFGGISIIGTNPGDFSETTTCGASIASNASCTITVTFKPIGTGKRTATVSISDNGGGSPQRIVLTGKGI